MALRRLPLAGSGSASRLRARRFGAGSGSGSSAASGSASATGASSGSGFAAGSATSSGFALLGGGDDRRFDRWCRDRLGAGSPAGAGSARLPHSSFARALPEARLPPGVVQGLERVLHPLALVRRRRFTRSRRRCRGGSDARLDLGLGLRLGLGLLRGTSRLRLGARLLLGRPAPRPPLPAAARALHGGGGAGSTGGAAAAGGGASMSSGSASSGSETTTGAAGTAVSSQLSTGAGNGRGRLGLGLLARPHRAAARSLQRSRVDAAHSTAAVSSHAPAIATTMPSVLRSATPTPTATATRNNASIANLGPSREGIALPRGYPVVLVGGLGRRRLSRRDRRRGPSGFAALRRSCRKPLRALPGRPDDRLDHAGRAPSPPSPAAPSRCSAPSRARRMMSVPWTAPTRVTGRSRREHVFVSSVAWWRACSSSRAPRASASFSCCFASRSALSRVSRAAFSASASSSVRFCSASRPCLSICCLSFWNSRCLSAISLSARLITRTAASCASFSSVSANSAAARTRWRASMRTA